MLYEMIVRMRGRQKQAVLIGLDIACVILAFALARLLVGTGLSGAEMLPVAAKVLPVCIAVAVATIVYTGVHRQKLIAYEMTGIVDTGFVAGSLAAASLLLNRMPGPTLLPGEIVVLAMSFLVCSVSARLVLLRIVRRAYVTGGARTNIVIYGAGQTGRQLAAALATDDRVVPVAFVDDNPRLQSQTIAGLRVHSPVHLKDLVQRKQVGRVVLAMPSAGRGKQGRITNRLRDIGCEVHSLPSFAQIVDEHGAGDRAPAFDIHDILGRNRLEEELPGVSQTYAGRSILVTGAAGSIGSELCRQLVTCGPERLVLLDHNEHGLYNIQRELSDLGSPVTLVPVLGSICEASLVAHVMQEHGIEIVLHAAAYKHLPMVQTNAIEGLRNNVLGTKILADAASAAGVDRFILVSSDKAVRPSSVMGSTKRMAEQILQDLATRSKGTRFSMVRFGNVMGSSGSVIPLFEEQIARGGPVTVTDRNVTRYFMTVSEAVRLVLLAGSFARGGDVFVLDMGEPVEIYQIARQMIEGAGYTVRDAANADGDIAIALMGLRPGEKLHEELLIGSDMLTTPHSRILRAQEEHLSEIEMAAALNDIRRSVDTRDHAGAEIALRKWVATRAARALDVTAGSRRS